MAAINGRDETTVKKWNPIRAAMLGAIAGIILGVPHYYPRLVAGGAQARDAFAQMAGMAIGLAALFAAICVVRNWIVKN